MSKPITLTDEIADLKRELKMRESAYPRWRSGITDPRKLKEMYDQHQHQIACTQATIKRLEALIPTQTSLF